MSEGGDDPFRNFSQQDPLFGSTLYPPHLPPFEGTGSQAQPDGPSGVGSSSAAAAHGVFGGAAHAYGTSSAAAAAYAGFSAPLAFGGMAGPAQGFSAYGVPGPYYPMLYQGGRVPMREPPRHSTSSMSGFQGGPYTFNGKFYLVDAGYPNRPGFLAPYKGIKYHQQRWRRGPGPYGERELFNKAHSSLRSVIEQSFGMLKMKRRILYHGIPSYQESMQTEIILACCALHNYVIEHCDDDLDFELAANVLSDDTSDEDSEPENRPEADEEDDDEDKNRERDEIAHAYYMAQ